MSSTQTAPVERVVAVTVALLGLVFLSVAGASAANLAVARSERVVRTFPAVVALEVNVGAGDVTVTASPRADVRVDQTVRYSWRSPGNGARLVGDVLTLGGGCRGITFGVCSVDARVEVPIATRVTLKSGSGDVTIAGLRHGVQLRTGSGDVRVSDVVGGVDARTSSGDVDLVRVAGTVSGQSSSGDVFASALDAPRITLHTRSGNVTLDGTVRVPEWLDAETSSGDVDVVVADGVYDVRATSSSGDVSQRLRQDPASANKVTARTRSGDVTVRSRSAPG